MTNVFYSLQNFVKVIHGNKILTVNKITVSRQVVITTQDIPFMVSFEDSQPNVLLCFYVVRVIFWQNAFDELLGDGNYSAFKNTWKTELIISL